jgi:hypothetical protein
MRVEVQLFGISQKKVACKHGGLRRFAGIVLKPDPVVDPV